MADSIKTAGIGYDLPIVVIREAFERAPGLCKYLQNSNLACFQSELAELAAECKGAAPCILVADRDEMSDDELQNLAKTLDLGRSVTALMLVDKDDPDLFQHLLRMGFSGILRRDAPASVFDRAIQALAEGELWAPRKSVAAVIRELLDNQSAKKLTAREEEILRLIAKGYTNREVGEMLFISRETVRWHVRSINSKLGTRERLETIKCAAASPPKIPPSIDQPNFRRRVV